MFTLNILHAIFFTLYYIRYFTCICNSVYTSSPAIADKEPIRSYAVVCMELPCSMLMMAIPDVEILAVRLFAIWINLFARWYQRYGLRGLKFEGIGSA